MSVIDFDEAFKALTGNKPFPWQQSLYARFVSDGPENIPASCNLPTGLGKTSVIAIWLIALANGANVPRRLVYVVNRRTVVDQTTYEVEKYKGKNVAGIGEFALSTLRGQFADNREWSADPSKPAVICGTVDMIGSRLLFSGYGVGFKGKPLHAGFLGQDSLLVHDEAHLEPAFQKLIQSIEAEQDRCKDIKPLRVMELTATTRGAGSAFELTDSEMCAPETIPAPPEEPAKESPLEIVHRRMRAKKGIEFHSFPKDQLAKKIGELVEAKWKDSGKAILIFVRTVADVAKVEETLLDQNKGVVPKPTQILTGTLRGLERDRLAEADPIFARFVSEPKVEPQQRTVYLICTSAGEVGVDLSADHMISDLTTLESMFQRFGRVNRRGMGQADIDIFYESEPDPKKKDDAYEKARWKTKSILERLRPCRWNAERREAAPLELRALSLTQEDRVAAFAPEPTILPVTDILLDAWTLTTINRPIVKEKLPGRPPVEPYLHGLTDDRPQTTIAWRREAELLTPEVLERNKLEPEDILDLFPLKPHEELSGQTDGKNKVFEQLEEIAARDATRASDERLAAWVIEPDGSIAIYPLAKLVEKDKLNKPVVFLGGRTVLLPPRAGGLSNGLLKGDEPFTEAIKNDYDVSDRWYVDKAKTIRRRWRGTVDDADYEQATQQMRLIRLIHIPAPGDDEEAEGWEWLWFARPKSADDDGSKSAMAPIRWPYHTNDVSRNATLFADALLTQGSDLHRALVLAAKFHDLGKKREVWQRSIGNPTPTDWHEKSGKGWKPREITTYRHEFGSLVDLESQPEFQDLTDDTKELVRHLIATHHGRGRPHFPADEVFDPGTHTAVTDSIAAEVPRRFARLQRKYGRWGLAYLESLLRAADWAASANPTGPEGEDKK